MKKEILKTIISPGAAMTIGSLTILVGSGYTAFEHNLHKTEQPHLHNASKGRPEDTNKEVLVFDKKSLIARHVRVETNQRKPIKSRGALAMLAGGGVSVIGIGLYLNQPARTAGKTNSE